jgi:DNA-binding beta-propeller fold protein YncE
VQSVAVGDGIVAVAVEVAPVVSADGRQTPSNGAVVLMDTTGRILKTVGVGVLPDHVSFTPDKKTVLVAGEGEPLCSLENSATTPLEAKDPALASDALGTVSLIDVSNGAVSATVTTLDFSSFDKTALLAENVRVFFPGSTAAQDLEPEYITTNAAGTRAYVTLQEANAIAVVDLVNKTILDVAPLGDRYQRPRQSGSHRSQHEPPVVLRRATQRYVYARHHRLDGAQWPNIPIDSQRR